MGYSPWGHKELDTTEHTHIYTYQVMHWRAGGRTPILIPLLTKPSLLFSISLIFGALTVVTGIIGVILGAETSRRYKKVNPQAEPLICAASLLAAAPCLFLALILAPTTLLASYVSEGPFRGGSGLQWVGNCCFI